MKPQEKEGINSSLMPGASQVEIDANIKKRARKQNMYAYIFISPWLIGFIGFVLGPMIASLYLSFTDYDMLSSPNWVGIQNYVTMFTDDSRFWIALKVTLIFVLVSTPMKLAFALFIAMLMNTKHKGSTVYSTLYYVPSIIGGSVAVAVIWKQIFGRDGALNAFLGHFNFEAVNWVADPDHALSVLILLVVWQFGSPMIIFLAGLRQIPNDLYEAASVDGASSIAKFFKVTLPLLTPVIFFNLVMQTIGGFMTFTQAFLITSGGPFDRTLFYALYLYEKAFAHFQMGYASALAWILLIIVALFTAIIFKSSEGWVYYESEGGK